MFPDSVRANGRVLIVRSALRKRDVQELRVKTGQISMKNLVHDRKWQRARSRLVRPLRIGRHSRPVPSTHDGRYFHGGQGDGQIRLPASPTSPLQHILPTTSEMFLKLGESNVGQQEPPPSPWVSSRIIMINFSSLRWLPRCNEARLPGH